MGIKIKQIGGEEILEFLVFNFDGEGSSIVFNYDTDKLEIYDRNSTKDLLFGENGKECKCEYIKE